MKKIVSTMFKYGAICASLTTVFADEDFEKSYRTTEARLGLISDETLLVEDTITHSLHQKFADENPQLIKRYPWLIEGYSRLEEKICISKTQDIHCCYCGIWRFDDLLSDNISLEQQCLFLCWIADSLIDFMKTKNKTESFDLSPNCIFIYDSDQTDSLQIYFARNSKPISELMQFNEDPRKAFAHLMLYVTHPKLRPYFEHNKMRVYEGKFQRYSEIRNEWVYLEGDFTSSRIATRFLNEELTWEQITEYLESSETYENLLKALKIVAKGTTLDERSNARDKAVDEYHFEELFDLLREDVPELLYTAQLLECLDVKDEATFHQEANKHPKTAEGLLKTCSTNPYKLICKEKGETQISPEAMKILEKWFQQQEETQKLRVQPTAIDDVKLTILP